MSMPWNGHSLLGRRAVEVLPDWEKVLIRPSLDSQALKHPLLPAPIRDGAEKLAAFCHLPDWIYEEEFSRYCYMDDGRPLPHELVDDELNANRLKPSPDGNCRLYQRLMDKMIDSIRAGDWDMVVINGGILGHILQDPLAPGHAVDNSIIYQLFPDPDESRHLRIHSLFDNATDEFVPLPPRLLGKSSSEAAYHLVNYVFRGVSLGKKCIYPVMMSAFRGEPLCCQAKLLADQCRQASFITASAWHTAFCIAYNRFNEEEYDRLQQIRLTEILPYFWHPSAYSEMLPGYFVVNSRKIPMELYEHSGKNDIKTVKVQDGFGISGYAGVKFYIDGSRYSSFRCRVGIAAGISEGIFPGRRTRFTVEVSAGENSVYSNDMDYGMEKVAEAVVCPGEAMQEVTADIRGMKSLALIARSDLEGPDGKVFYAMPHLGIVNPVLSKSI